MSIPAYRTQQRHVAEFAVDDARGPAFSPPGREISSSAIVGIGPEEYVLAVAGVSRKPLFCLVNQMRATANSRAEQGASLQPPLPEGSIALVSGNWSKSEMPIMASSASATT